MADGSAILSAFRQELINAALVRAPSVAGALPPAHVEPINGAVAPGDREPPEEAQGPDTPVVSLFYEEVNVEAFNTARVGVVAVHYRGMTTAALRAVHALDAAVRARLVERLDPALAAAGGQHGLGYFAGAGAPSLPAPGLWVRQASVFAPLGRLSESKATGYHRVARYALEVDS